MNTDQKHRWLGKVDIVVSTSPREFLGLSVLEAVSAKARPLIPDALCYPEQYPYPAGDSALLLEKLSNWLSRAYLTRLMFPAGIILIYLKVANYYSNGIFNSSLLHLSIYKNSA